MQPSHRTIRLKILFLDQFFYRILKMRKQSTHKIRNTQFNLEKRVFVIILKFYIQTHRSLKYYAPQLNARLFLFLERKRENPKKFETKMKKKFVCIKFHTCDRCEKMRVMKESSF